MADTTRTTSGTPYGGTSTAVPAGDWQREQRPHGDGSADPVADAKKIGSELVGAVRDSAMSLLDNQRNRAADQIASIGEALRRSAHSFDDTGGEVIVRYADDAARYVTDFADTLRNRSWDELASDVESFARRWPMAFMASAIGIGFIAGRFFMSSGEHSSGQRSNSPMARTGTETQPGMRRHDVSTPAAGATGAPKPGFGTPSTGE